LPSVDIEVYFGNGSARVTERAAAILNPLGKALADKRLAQATFLIAGHTDAKGSAEYNRQLSSRRAEAVRQYLIERFGIDPKRLVSRGYGFDRLKTPGRPLGPENRRVQIVNWTSQVPR
jgi:outer membrane protein OmpA-like peptidoglycan-associated protein